MKKNLFKGFSCLAALLLASSCALTVVGERYEGSINAVLGGSSGSSSTTGEAGEYLYKTDFTADGKPSDEGMKKLIEAEDAYNDTAMGENAVLVYNNGALPLSSDVKKVSLFGRSTVDPVYRCTSAGPTIDEKRVITPAAAFEQAGFSVNKTLLDAYKADPTQRLNGSTQSIGEVPASFYTDSLKATFTEYGDAAIVMFSRLAGEGIDAAKKDADGVCQLSLHPQESDLLKMVKSYKDEGKIKNVIVLLNSAYALELDWLSDEAYGVDACLWIGNPGLTGFSAIPDLLTGKINPSGHFVDTYATNALSAPATQNMGDTAFSGNFRTYAMYAEGIYVGYKYYETRYEDLILDRYAASSSAGTFASSNGWNYAEEITYPFGYGLSYTSFEQTLDSVTWNSDNTITVKATVKNTGDVAGKSVVEVYAQTPYTEHDKQNNVEKSAIQLLDFEKTKLLAPGESETLTITADKYLLASWDSTAHDGKGGYILDDGTYYISIGDNAHDALNNVLAAKGASGMIDENGNPVEGDESKAISKVQATFDDTTYQYSSAGKLVENQFDEGIFATDYNYYYPGKVTYLTRKDWNTFPKTYENLEINDEMIKIHSGNFYEDLKKELDAPKDYTLKTDAGLLFIDMLGVEWDDDEKWTKFLSQLSVGELALIVSDSWGQKAVTTISKPQNYQCDGPDGGSTKYKYGDKGNNTTYVNQGTMACSWNKELFQRRGDFLAEDAFYNNTSCTMGPGVDIHRSPFSGRNHEYYSEDGVFSYVMGAVQCKAMQEKGTVAMLKHICGNDQETNRKGVCEFMTEQALRESSLKGFEGCMVKGGAMSAMAAFNALGVCNVARNRALLTNVVRGEWDWKGFIDTDANDCTDTPALCVVSGIDEFCLTSAIDKEVAKAVNAGDKYLLNALMETNKRFYYTYLQSNLINGLTRTSVVSEGMPWWKSALIALDVIFGAMTLASIGGTIFLLFTEKKEQGGEDHAA
ncbi:MAG: glycoside hydrolase family 3 C-terminal domain-containing protein [Clostridia bacterium]|nr:glycoside hydrolase family 3 C-terminal domain-containing protein [Clostridia bacterium]